jgi:hypothetical protein
VVGSLPDLRAQLATLAERGPDGASAVYSTLPAWASAPAGATSGGPAPEAAATYVGTGAVDLERLYGAARPRMVHLPPYEFDDRRCAIEFPPGWRDRLATPPARPPQPLHRIDLVPVPATTEIHGSARVVALVDPSTTAEQVLSTSVPAARILRLVETTVVHLDEEFLATEDDLERVADLVVDGGYTHLVFGLGFEDQPAADAADLDRRIRKNLYGLFLLAKALVAVGARLTVVVLTHTALAAVPGERVVAENATLAGLAKVLPREYPLLPTAVVDVGTSVPPQAVARALLSDDVGITVLRGEQRLREVFAELTEIESVGDGRYLRPGGTYLITGGTGALGFATARAFAARQRGINLVLLSRSGAPVDASVATDELVGLGATVRILRADTGDPDALTRAVKEVRGQFGRIDGVVHAAGIAGGNIIAFRELADFDAVVRPKVQGAFMLDQLTRDDRPDFIAYFSSVATVFPASAQGDYAAANYYLDNLARANPDPACHVIAFDWVAWKEIGMAVSYGSNQDTTFKALPTALGLAALDQGLGSRQSRVFVGEVHYDGDLAQVLKTYDVTLAEPVARRIDAAVQVREGQRRPSTTPALSAIDAIDVSLTGRPDGEFSPDEIAIARCWAYVFGVNVIDVEADFFTVGGDSIAAISLVDNVATALNVDLAATALLVERSVAGLARHVGEVRASGSGRAATVEPGAAAMSGA